jgi:hypothetical protein
VAAGGLRCSSAGFTRAVVFVDLSLICLFCPPSLGELPTPARLVWLEDRLKAESVRLADIKRKSLPLTERLPAHRTKLLEGLAKKRCLNFEIYRTHHCACVMRSLLCGREWICVTLDRDWVGVALGGGGLNSFRV